jgi:anaerobic dimethyl sulfoxide reductase subunit C (anchor subunit)
MSDLHRTNNRESSGSLIAFTTLAPLAVGGLLGLLVFRIPQAVLSIDHAAVIVFIVGLLAMIFSLFHLGRPLRAPLAILHLSTSWLSREVILFSIFLLLLFCYAVFPAFYLEPGIISLIGWIGALVGLVSTYATGKTYHLKSRPVWDHWSTIFLFILEALSAGVLFGLFAAHIFVSIIELQIIYKVFLTLILVLSIVLSWMRFVSSSPTNPEALASRKLVLGTYSFLVVMRMAVGLIALVMIWIPGEALYYAWMAALLGESIDRVLFFNTVIPVTLVSRYT